MKALVITLVLALAGCSSLTKVGVNTTPGLDLGMFVTGDLKNAEALALAAHLDLVATCWGALEPVAMQTPHPETDGAITLATRYMVLQSAIQNPSCAVVLLPAVLKLMGKLAPAPFGVVLPF